MIKWGFSRVYKVEFVFEKSIHVTHCINTLKEKKKTGSYQLMQKNT